MSDGAISQSELDALLGSASGGLDFGGGGSSSSTSSSNLDLSFLKEFASKSASSLGSIIGSMTGENVSVSEPKIESKNRDSAMASFGEMVVSISSDFSGGLFGDHFFVMDPEFVKKIVSAVNQEEDPDIDDMAISVVAEIVSQMTGSEITTLNGTGKLPGLASNPASGQNVHKAMVKFPQGDFVVQTYTVPMGGKDYSVYEVMAEEVAKGIISAYGGDSASSAGFSPMDASMGMGAGAAGGTTMGGAGMGGAGMGGAPMAGVGMGGAPVAGMGYGTPMGGMPMGYGAPMGGMPMGYGAPMGGMPGMAMPSVQNVTYPPLTGGTGIGEQGNIGLIMDVKMEMTVELGRTKREIKDILGMGEGTIIELEKQAGEPVDILVNNKPIAKGEVVVIDENFGVRVTEILSPAERLSDGQ